MVITAAERKTKSEEICRRNNVPINPYLPVVENEENSTLRDCEEIAWRAIALCLVAMKGEGMEQEQVLRIVETYHLREKLTPNETEFIFGQDLPTKSFVSFSWRYEAYWVLLWALGYVSELGAPDSTCNLEQAVNILSDCKDSTEFISRASLRAHSEILDQVDLIYRYHWACVETRLKSLDTPVKLNCGVVYERHYALNWLVNYMNQKWDDVSTDT